ncbi:MAG: DUF2634 domain-containing protein [Candidatus Heteroscillospira sp.]|jgi:hypothetical protein
MSLFPIYSIPAAQSWPEMYTDVLWDYQAGRPVWQGGNPVIVTGLEAVKSWAWRAIATARYRWPIYSWDYGCELERLVGQPYSADTKLSEAVRYVSDSLLASPYITACSVTNAAFDGGRLTMTVELSTVYGKEKLYV